MAKTRDEVTIEGRLSPRAAAEWARARLGALADAERARGFQRFFKEPVRAYGVPSPEVRAILRELVAGLGEGWGLADAVRFCDLMVRDPHLEAHGLGFELVARFVKQAGPELLADVERWLTTACGNWALVDTLAPHVLAPLLRRHPGLVPRVVAWNTSRQHWLRRGSVVAFVPLVRRGPDQARHLDTAYRVAERCFGDREDLMHKAVGWLLREAGKADMARLEAFLRRHGPRIPRTSLRYAIERFPPVARKRLLEETRAAVKDRKKSR